MTQTKQFNATARGQVAMFYNSVEKTARADETFYNSCSLA